MLWQRADYPENGRQIDDRRGNAASTCAIDSLTLGGISKAAGGIHNGVGDEMKLDQATIKWIESAIGDIAHGEVRLILCDKQIVKIIAEDHKMSIRALDEKHK